MKTYLQEACSVIDAAIKEGIDGEERADLRGIVQEWLEPLALSTPQPVGAPEPVVAIPWDVLKTNRPGSEPYIEELQRAFPGNALLLTDEVALFCNTHGYCEEGGAMAFLGDALHQGWYEAHIARFAYHWDDDDLACVWEDNGQKVTDREDWKERRWLFVVQYAREKLAALNTTATPAAAAPGQLSYLGVALTPITGPARNQEEGNARLLELAAVLDVAQYYEQSEFLHECGAPACAMGFFFRMHTERYKIVGGVVCDVEGSRWNSGEALQGDLHINTQEEYELFSLRGCGNAGHSGVDAANYIRGFVGRRRAQGG